MKVNGYVLDGQLLYEMRTTRNWTMEELGRRTGYSRRAINAWEKGTNEPKAESLLRLADALECDPRSLMTAVEVDLP